MSSIVFVFMSFTYSINDLCCHWLFFVCLFCFCFYTNVWLIFNPWHIGVVEMVKKIDTYVYIEFIDWLRSLHRIEFVTKMFQREYAYYARLAQAKIIIKHSAIQNFVELAIARHLNCLSKTVYLSVSVSYCSVFVHRILLTPKYWIAMFTCKMVLHNL